MPRRRHEPAPDHDAVAGYRPSALVLSISDPQNGRVLGRFVLRVDQLCERVGPMDLSSATPGEGTEAISNPHAVAGRIDASPSDLVQAVDAWVAYLRAKKKKPKTLSAYRGAVLGAARDEGWSSVEDLTHDNILGWMAHKQEGGDWTKAATYNRNLICLRSLTRYLRRSGRIAADPLIDEETEPDDGDDGSRAARIDEARAMIRHAWARGISDKRAAKGNRALYWMCLFAHGCRAGEPELWRWKHLLLDAVVPHVLWTKEIQKNRRKQTCALAPELAELLRRHREQMRELARTTPIVVRRNGAARRVDPADPEAFVFPIVPPRTTFRADRDAAGIVSIDQRGRPFTPHSARKFFDTELSSSRCGVMEKMVDWLMRHRGKVEARYYDPTLHEQAEAAARLPRLWPEPLVDNPGDNSLPRSVNLTSSGGLSHDGLTTPMIFTSHNSAKSPGPTDGPAHRCGNRPAALRGPGDSAESSLELPGTALIGPALAGFESTIISPEMPRGGQITVDRTWLAGLLEAFARELRKEPPHGPQPAERPA
jgi:integrase